MWPDLGRTNPRLRLLVAQHLAATATGDEQAIKSAPSECLTAVLHAPAMSGSAHPVRARLRVGILHTLSLRFPSAELLATLSSDDALGLATMLWDREQWRQFGVVLRHIDPRMGRDLSGLVGTDEGRRRLTRWAQVANTTSTLDDLRLFMVTVASAVPTSCPFTWLLRSLAEVAAPKQFISVLRARMDREC